MPQQEPTQNWLPALTLVAALHLAAWWGLTHFREEIERPKPLEEISVALLAPPPPPSAPPVAPPPRIPQPSPATVASPKQAQQPVVQPVLSSAAADAPVMAAPPVAEAPKPVAAAPASPPAPPRPAAEPVLELPSFHADYLNNPPPAYPFAARRRGIEGNVLVRAEISSEGKCLRVELKKSSGADLLDQAALDAVKSWRFVPARRGSQAVIAWVDVPLAFKLEN